MNKGRVEAFSDGVFAIAITLLVLTIAVPTRYDDLAGQLQDRWPGLAAYIVSFAVIGVMWLNHHTVFSRVGHIDRTFLLLNMLLLMTIAFLPYPTGVLGEALARHEGTRTAAAFYGVTMAVNAYCWSAMWLWAAKGRRLLAAEFPEDRRAAATWAFVAGSVAYTLAVGVAFLSPYAFLALHGAFGVYYAVDPIARRADGPLPAERAGAGDGAMHKEGG